MPQPSDLLIITTASSGISACALMFIGVGAGLYNPKDRAATYVAMTGGMLAMLFGGCIARLAGLI